MRVSACSLGQILTVECGFQPLPQKLSGVLLKKSGYYSHTDELVNCMAANQSDPLIGIQYELRQLATATTELADRIDTLTVVVTDGFAELKQIAQQQAVTAERQAKTAESQAKTAESQAESVSQLIALLERKPAG
jgi:methyl-accepting chemotaxis protein